ncbi:MAG: exosortase O [Chloroflexota bacterium]
MREITHDQAREYLLAAADGLLSDPERTALQQHLRTCPACRAESEKLNGLQHALRQTLHRQWDAVSLPQAPLVTELPPQEPLAPRLGRIALNGLLLALWVWLYWAVFGYLRIIFSSEEFRTNQIVLMIVLVLIFTQFRRQRPHLDALPQVYWPGLTLALGGSGLYLVVERFLDINTLSASIFGLATYGLLGLWMSPRRWQEGLPAALLLIGTLPFGDHLQTFIGYPMRVATAAVVRDGLHAFGVQSIGVDTILVLESGLAQVDLPCSGIKSLWTGLLFLIAAAWIERRPIDLRWLGVAALMGGLLFVANVARVGTLVVVDQVAGWKMAAEMIHVPLGVLAFVVVCGVALWLMQGSKPSARPSLASAKPVPAASPPAASVKRPLWLVPLLAVAFAVMALLYTPRPQTVSAQAGVTWNFPDRLQLSAYPLSPGLYAWATSGGADSAERWNFTWQVDGHQVSGSFLFLTSDTWRGQHRPERCFEVEGLTVESSHTVMFPDDFPARVLEVSHGPVRASAFYWLQTGNRVTDDFATRIWADLTPDRPRWVLVTILLDDVYPPDSAAVQSLLELLRAAVADSMEGESP